MQGLIVSEFEGGKVLIVRKSIALAIMVYLVVGLPINLLMTRATVANSDRAVDLVSLGDSIAFGLNAPSGQGYTDLFYSYLQSQTELEGAKLHNFAKQGAQSSNLLDQLNNDGNVQGSLGDASVVTVSIGGNNLLEPVIRSVAKAYHLDLSDPQLNANLGRALQNDTSPTISLLGLALSGTLETELDAGVAKFKSDWLQTIEKIKTLAPKSQIYVLTVYNPFPKDDLLFSLFDPYVQQINNAIKAGDGYSIADIYTCFLQGSAQNPLDYDLLRGHTDPHPTQQGHKMISQTLSFLFDLGSASSWESKTGVATNKTWTIKFSRPLVALAGGYIEVYTTTGLLVDISVKPGGLWSDSLVVSPPIDGYSPGHYSLLIKDGLPSKSDHKLEGSVRMDFTVQ